MNQKLERAWEFLLDFLTQTFYFLITIVLVGALGVWLPFAIDKAQLDCILPKTVQDLPWNLVTYAISIFAVAYIDRALDLYKISNQYRRHNLEFLILFLILLLSIFLIYQCLVHSKFSRYDESLVYALVFTFATWMLWIYQKVKTPKENSYSTIGGPMQ